MTARILYFNVAAQNTVNAVFDAMTKYGGSYQSHGKAENPVRVCLKHPPETRDQLVRITKALCQALTLRVQLIGGGVQYNAGQKDGVFLRFNADAPLTQGDIQGKGALGALRYWGGTKIMPEHEAKILCLPAPAQPKSITFQPA